MAKHAQIAAAKAAKAKDDKGETDAPGPGDGARQEDGDENAAKSGKKKAEKPPRVSTTDAEARVMKMADGGFRPAHNAQVTTATGSVIIVGIDVSDRGLLPDACEQAKRR